MTERRYSEEEVGAIFELATKAQSSGRRQIGSGEGMTLAGLQEIAKEIGVPAELVAQAARSLDAGGKETSQSLIGIPVGVGNSVELGRKMSDAEWQRLVTDLRDTFDANGKVETDGNLRQWTNSRLQISVEQTDAGSRVRLKTYNTNLVGLLGGGAMMLGMAAFFLLVILAKHGMDAPWKLTFPAVFGAAGAVSIAWGAIRLPRWASTRRRQFKELIDRLMLPSGSV
jgi:hypothetical protein